MKVLIVMFLGTVIAQGGIPKLKCWQCEGESKDGKYPCNDPRNFTLEDCEKKYMTMCIDVFDPEYKSFKKGCADECYLKRIKSIAANPRKELVYEVCNITECNPRRYSDYLDLHYLLYAQMY